MPARRSDQKDHPWSHDGRVVLRLLRADPRGAGIVVRGHPVLQDPGRPGDRISNWRSQALAGLVEAEIHKRRTPGKAAARRIEANAPEILVYLRAAIGAQRVFQDADL